MTDCSRETATKDPKISNTIAVHELLASLQNKIVLMDKLSLEQTCKSSYTEEEILKAKKIFAETVKTDARTQDEQNKNHLQDILQAFEETNPNDIPTYVARDLAKVPTAVFDSDSVSRLLNDVASLKTVVELMNKKLETSERFAEELKQEVLLLRSTMLSHALNVNGIESDVAVSENTKNAKLEMQVNDRERRASRSMTSQSKEIACFSENMYKEPALMSEVPRIRYAKEISRYRPCHRPSAASVFEARQLKSPAPQTKANIASFIPVDDKNQPRCKLKKPGNAPASEDCRAAVPTMIPYVLYLDQTMISQTKLKKIPVIQTNNTFIKGKDKKRSRSKRKKRDNAPTFRNVESSESFPVYGFIHLPVACLLSR